MISLSAARRVLGNDHDITLSMREDLSRATLYGDSSLKEKRKALQTLEDTVAVMRRVVGVPLAALVRRVVVGACSAKAHCRLQRTTAMRIAAVGCCASKAAYQRPMRNYAQCLLE